MAKPAAARDYPRLGDSSTTFTERLGSPAVTTSLCGQPVLWFEQPAAQLRVMFEHDRAVAIFCLPAGDMARGVERQRKAERPSPADLRAAADSPDGPDQVVLVSGSGNWLIAYRSCPVQYLDALREAMEELLVADCNLREPLGECDMIGRINSLQFSLGAGICVLSSLWLCAGLYGVSRSRVLAQTPGAPAVIEGNGSVSLPPGASVRFTPRALSLPAGASSDPAPLGAITVTNLSDQVATVTRSNVVTIIVPAGSAVQLVDGMNVTRNLCWYGAEPFGMQEPAPTNIVGCIAGPDGVTMVSFTTIAYAGGPSAREWVTYPVGWSLVAGPEGTFNRSIGDLYTYQAGDLEYETVPARTQLSSGVGYWAYYAAPTRQQLPTAGPRSSERSLPAGQFIMIGNPGNVPVVVNGGDAVYAYDPSTGTYRGTTVLQPGEGGWAYSVIGGTARLLPTAIPATDSTSYRSASEQAQAARPSPESRAANHLSTDSSARLPSWLRMLLVVAPHRIHDGGSHLAQMQ